MNRFEALCWMEVQRLYLIALDGQGRAESALISHVMAMELMAREAVGL